MAKHFNSVTLLLCCIFFIICGVFSANIVEQCREDGNNSQTQLTDLNADCQQMILEELDFIDLIRMTQMNRQFSNVANYAFKRNLANRIVSIRLGDLNDKRMVVEYSNHIEIRDYNVAVQILTRFGRFIQKLQFTEKVVDPDPENTILTLRRIFNGRHVENNVEKNVENIVEIANRNCADLKELKMRTFDKNPLENITKPFQSVETVEFSGTYKTLDGANMTLNEIFPNMHTLKLVVERITNGNCIEVHFPRLKRLDVTMAYENGFTERQIKQLIKMNPQIESLYLRSGKIRFLLNVRDLLPNLEHLGLFNMYMGDLHNTIHFENIKTLSIGGTINVFPQNIIFDRLQELDTPFSNAYSGSIEFIRKHQTLKKLQITGYTSDWELSKLENLIPAVAELSLLCYHDTKPEEFIAFLNSNNQFKRITLRSGRHGGITKRDWEIIRFRIENQWNIVKIDGGYLIERKAEPESEPESNFSIY